MCSGTPALSLHDYCCKSKGPCGRVQADFPARVRTHSAFKEWCLLHLAKRFNAPKLDSRLPAPRQTLPAPMADQRQTKGTLRSDSTYACACVHTCAVCTQALGRLHRCTWDAERQAWVVMPGGGGSDSDGTCQDLEQCRLSLPRVAIPLPAPGSARAPSVRLHSIHGPQRAGDRGAGVQSTVPPEAQGRGRRAARGIVRVHLDATVHAPLGAVVAVSGWRPKEVAADCGLGERGGAGSDCSSSSSSSCCRRSTAGCGAGEDGEGWVRSSEGRPAHAEGSAGGAVGSSEAVATAGAAQLCVLARAPGRFLPVDVVRVDRAPCEQAEQVRGAVCNGPCCAVRAPAPQGCATSTLRGLGA